MRKYVAAALIAFGALAVPAFGAGTGEHGPACIDVTGGSGAYVGGTVAVAADLAANPCNQFLYTLWIYSDTAATDLITSSSDYVDISTDHPQIGFSVPGVEDTDGTVCVVLTTSADGGRHVFDRAPDASFVPPCMPISSSSPGFVGFH